MCYARQVKVGVKACGSSIICKVIVIEFAVITPTPSHVYNVLPILTENALENNLLSDKTSHTAGVSLKIKDLIVLSGVTTGILSHINLRSLNVPVDM